MSKPQILASLASIETREPLFFGDMPIDDDTVRDIFAASMAKFSASLDFQFATPLCREVSLLATLTHVMLEAACLRYQLHASGQAANWATNQLLERVAKR